MGESPTGYEDVMKLLSPFYCTAIMLPGRTGIRYTLGMGMSRYDKY